MTENVRGGDNSLVVHCWQYRIKLNSLSWQLTHVSVWATLRVRVCVLSFMHTLYYISYWQTTKAHCPPWRIVFTGTVYRCPGKCILSIYRTPYEFFSWLKCSRAAVQRVFTRDHTADKIASAKLWVITLCLAEIVRWRHRGRSQPSPTASCLQAMPTNNKM